MAACASRGLRAAPGGAAVCSMARWLDGSGGPWDLSLLAFSAALAPFQPLRRGLQSPASASPPLRCCKWQGGVAGARAGRRVPRASAVCWASPGCGAAFGGSAPAQVREAWPSRAAALKNQLLETPFLSPPLSGLEEPITVVVRSCR